MTHVFFHVIAMMRQRMCCKRLALALIYISLVPLTGCNQPVEPKNDAKDESQEQQPGESQKKPTDENVPLLHKAEKYNRIIELAGIGNSARDNQILRFIVGVDDETPHLMTDQEIQNELNDPWATKVLRQNIFPSNIVEVLQQLKLLEQQQGGTLKRRSFLVGEGGQFPVSIPHLNRTFRYIVSWANDQGQAEIFLAIPAGTRDGLTELIAWDSKKQSLNYYRREGTNTWTWRGDTQSAFDPDSRAKGCFACHTNGNLLVKELERPWQNWHSELAGISSEVVPESLRPDDIPEIKELFDERATAQELEAQITKGIERSNRSRVDFRDGKLNNVHSMFSQILLTNNCNLRASEQKIVTVTDTTRFRLPMELFFDQRVFDKVIDLPIPGFATPILWPQYMELLDDANLRFKSGPILIPGIHRDSFFLGLSPIRAFEDSNLKVQLMNKGIVTKRFLVCLAMIDFPNPIFSKIRNSLNGFVSAIPETLTEATPLAAQDTLVEQILTSSNNEREVTADELDTASAAQQFAYYWNLGPDELESVAVEHLSEYLTAVMTRSQTDEGRDEIFKLMIQRRRQYQSIAPGAEQAEFDLLFPRTELEIPLGRMHRKGKFQAIP